MAISMKTWPPIAVRLLLAIAKRTHGERHTRYEPAAWLRQRPTPRHRSRWSRWTRRLADAGLIRRITEANRDRVRQVALTPVGQAWINEHCGEGAIAELDLHWDGWTDLLQNQPVASPTLDPTVAAVAKEAEL